jgi:HK97 family phage portal protein
MVALSGSIGRALNRMSGGLLGWFLEDSDIIHRMNGTRAMSYAPVFSCVNLISGAFTVMPLNLHRKTGRNIERPTSHPSYELLRWRPNAYQSPSVWKQQMVCHYALWGNARSYVRRENGRPVELIPLMPDRTVTAMIDGEKYHGTYIDPDDRVNQFTLAENAIAHPDRLVIMHDRDVWHVPGASFNGIEGLSVIRLARQSWSIGLGAEAHVGQQQKKGYSGGLMLEAPEGAFKRKEDAEEFLAAFKKHHNGAENSGSVALLRAGIKANVLMMSNQDAQFIEGRRFQREDVALWFGLQGIIGDGANSYASLEQKNLAFRMNCLAPISTKFEEESDLKLLNARERAQDHYHKFNDGAILRTEKSAAMAFASQGITARILSPNEARALFDLNPYEGGDTYENPAVTPGAPGESKNPPENDDLSEEMGAKQVRIAHLIGVEAGKVEAAAEQATTKGKNFLSWLDDFYDHKWPEKLAGWLEEIGVDAALATQHCEESRRLLIEVCDYSQPENLVQNVKKCVSTWKARANLVEGVQNV